MTREESLDALSQLSGVIGWLQHFRGARTRNEYEDREVEGMLSGLVAIREHVRRDYETQATRDLDAEIRHVQETALTDAEVDKRISG